METTLQPLFDPLETCWFTSFTSTGGGSRSFHAAKDLALSRRVL